MSTLITLKLPITDFECLKKALKNLGLKFTESGQILTLQEGITLRPGEIGFFTATVGEQASEAKVREIEREYRIVFTQKKLKLDERLKNIKTLPETERKAVMEEKKALDEHNKKVIEKMVNTIKERAKQKGFMIQNIQDQNNVVKLVLTRQ